MATRLPTVDEHGTIRLPAFEVPLSTYMSERARSVFIEQSLAGFPGSLNESQSINEMRRVVDRYHAPGVIRARELFPVEVETSTVGGVRVDRVTPRDGLPERNRRRILINLHGGGFLTGNGLVGLAESIPIAHVGQVCVVSLHYRMAPECKFPAASEDVASVYKDLLSRYRPQNIGIYGCSAGGLLTAESVAWFQVHDLPTPGAIGIFCAGADSTSGGDSSYTSTQLNGAFLSAPKVQTALETPSPYFELADLTDALAFPALEPTVLARFPPSLLITGTRDRFMSPAIHLHTQLCMAGVDARLHVWEGMWHGFLNTPDMPEAMAAYQEIAKFFERTLRHPSEDL